MNKKINKLINGQEDNYIFPFFWQHGEDESVLRKYMKVIDESNIKAVCVESRPHPDYCGSGWWHDMDIILEEARNRDMKVWILDDSHFPTGYANGAMKNADPSLSRRSLVYQMIECTEPGTEMKLELNQYKEAQPWQPNFIEQFLFPEGKPTYPGDELISISAIREGGMSEADIIDLTANASSEVITFNVPEGKWNIYICHSTRNRGVHRDYINMMDYDSCRILIDAVYESHYEHYKDDFGTTIAGFFSDEPELGNGHIYEMQKHLSEMDDLPWSNELAEVLKSKWRENYASYLPLIWRLDFAKDMIAKIRYDYMDAVTRLVEKNFSKQIGDWCRAHSVEYIGHVVEDNNQHARTGTSLGHYFRGLSGQDMAGIDDIGGQVMPQGENTDIDNPGAFGAIREGEFYHYILGKLASSAASIEPGKKGRAMCEIYGAYGWAEGVRLEKYLTDHFLVRGINHFVPHAFSPKEFPDPDCPPHFYAHGHNPQYRHFGELMKYLNRMCELMNGGRAVTPAAILYMGEAEWTGDFMHMQMPAQKLADAQIDYEILPSDVFTDREAFRTEIDSAFKVNGNEYKVFVVPETKYLCPAAVNGIQQLIEKHIPVIFVNRLPEKICDGSNTLPFDVAECKVAALDELVKVLHSIGTAEINIVPSDDRIRYRHYYNESDIYMFINEGTKVYRGEITIPKKGTVYAYNAWDNLLESVDTEYVGNGTKLIVKIEPLKSLLVVFDEPGIRLKQSIDSEKALMSEKLDWSDGWIRSIVTSISYPEFMQAKEVCVPDHLEEEQPEFSGFVRYEKTLNLKVLPSKIIMEITDAYEGVEVLVNGLSAGIQIVPTYLYDLTSLLKQGKNQIRIEVATTLERFGSTLPVQYAEIVGEPPKPTCPSGINGKIILWKSNNN